MAITEKRFKALVKAGVDLARVRVEVTKASAIITVGADRTDDSPKAPPNEIVL
ncbi:MAG TPA: hypothetical protein VG758_31715 [Hyphomicrobiaceae bacterium]|jgi:hypothetical protein|nr:hypothetical protein [Hyphomicrobiaceae bacterium]